MCECRTQIVARCKRSWRRAAARVWGSRSAWVNRRRERDYRRAAETVVGLQRLSMETDLNSTKTEASMDSNKDRAEGAGHEVKGTIKEKVGQLTNDPELEGE